MKKSKSSNGSVLGSYSAGRVKALQKARAKGMTYSAIAQREGISSTSVRRLLGVLKDR